MAQDTPPLPLHTSLEYALYTLERIRTVGTYTKAQFRERLDVHLAHIRELWWDDDSLNHDSYHGGKRSTWEPITSLEGLQRAVKLQTLALRRSDVDALSPLEGLKLQTLYLDHNRRLEDIAPIATLERLERLSLNHTAVRSLEALSGLQRLREVQVMGLALDDAAISVLADLEARRVTLKLDAEVRARVDQERARRAAAAAAAAPAQADPVAEELAACGLGTIAALWRQGVDAVDVECKTCLHHLVEVPADKLGQDALLRLTHLMCQRGDTTHALSFPRHSTPKTPLGMALNRWPHNPALVDALVEHTTRWDVPLDKPPVAIALESGGDHPEAQQLVEIATRYDMALLPTASLVMACAKGRLDLVKRAIESGARPDPSDHEETPLLAAVQRDHLDVAEYLLQAGADPNRRSADVYLSAPIHGCQSVAMLELLRAHGADPTAVDVYGHTALTRIVKRNKASSDALVQRLLELGCSIREVDGALLSWAHSANDPAQTLARCALLEAHGACLDPNRLDYGAHDLKQGPELKAAKDPFGLKTAKLETHFKQLLNLYNQPKKSGALEPGSLKWRIAIKLLRHMNHQLKGVDAYGWLSGQVDAAIQAYAPEDAVAAQLAALPSSIRRRLAAMLWIEGPTARDDIGYSALDYIMRLGDPFARTTPPTPEELEAHLKLALAMIEAGAKPGFDHFGKHTLERALSWDGCFDKITNTPLFDALCEPEAAAQVIHRLCGKHPEHGAPDTHQAWYGERAMTLAMTHGYAEHFIGRFCAMLSAEQVQQLLDTTPARADGMGLSEHDKLPLGAAATQGRADLVRLLLDAGADVEGIPSGSGRRLAWPLGCASTPEVARMLCEAGADIHARRGSLHGAIGAANAAVFNLMHHTHEGADYIGVLEVLRDAKASFDMPSSEKPGARDLLESCLDQEDEFTKARNHRIRAFLATLPARPRP